MTTIMNGREVAAAVLEDIKAEVRGMARPPKLVAILVGDDGASQTYVANKEKMCAEVGFSSEVLRMPAELSEMQLLEVVEQLNRDQTVDGFIVQLPLPPHIDEGRVIEAIDPRKDVDGFHPINVGRMVAGLPSYISATPMGILTMLRHYNIETAGKHCVVIGRSNIVGRPIANLLSQKGWDCTVTICHSRTKNLPEIVREADIIIAALGRPGFVTADMVREGAVVIDVGITRIPYPESPKGYRIQGDVDFDSVSPKASFITPVPGGVGVMTVVSLMQNTLKAAGDSLV